MTGTNKSQTYPITAVPEDVFWYYNRLLDEYNVDPLSSVTVNMCVQNDLAHSLELLTDEKDDGSATVTIPLTVLAVHDPFEEQSVYLWFDSKIKRVRVRKQQLAVLQTVQRQFQTHNFFVPISLIISSILFMTNPGFNYWTLGQVEKRKYLKAFTLSKDGNLGEAALVYRDDENPWHAIYTYDDAKQLPAPTVVVIDLHETDKAQLHFAK